MTNETTLIKNYFQSRQVPLSDMWLDSCIQWCKDENLPSNYTMKDLQRCVYEQWLLLDLREVEVACLPPNLNTHKKYNLTGNYSLQVMQVIDISKPKHWQLQKIRSDAVFTKNNWQDSEAAGTGKRVLQLTLTDGVQEVEAMEYKPVNQININMTPGIKVMLKGPLTIRRGKIMLEAHNLDVLGGEVEDIVVSHAAENVLARSLNLPENLNPRQIEEQNEQNEQSSLINNSTQPTVQNQIVNHPPPVQRQQINENKKPQFTRELNEEEEEERRIEQELEILAEAEMDIVNEQTTKLQRNKNSTPDIFEDDMDFNCIDLNELENKSITKPQTVDNSNVINISDSLELEDDDIFANIDIDEHLNNVEKEAEEKRNTSVSNNKMNLVKLLENKKNITFGVFKLRAKFKRVVKKLICTENEYKLCIAIEDESGEATVKMHSAVISNFVHLAPEVLTSFKQNILLGQKDFTQKVIKVMQKLKDCLTNLDNLMEIEVNKNEEYPVIVKIL